MDPTQDTSRNWSRWLLAVLLATAFGATAWLSIILTRELDRIATLWLSNGLLVGALLIAHRDRLPISLACLAANFIVNLIVGDPPGIALILSAANMLEVAVAIRAVDGVLGNAIDFMKPALLTRFYCYAVLLAPATSALLCAAVMWAFRGADFFHTFVIWYRADALGMAVMVPLTLALRPTDIRQAFRRLHPVWDGASFLLLIAVSILVFWQNKYPFLFMLFPPLLLVTFRLGFVGSACGIFSIAVIALLFTLENSGPLMLVRDASISSRVLAMQWLLATLILTTYPVCAVILAQRRLLSDIAGSEERFRVIAENSSDIVALTDVKGIWRYISPAVTAAFGWSTAELIGRNGLDFVHPDDADIYARGSAWLSTGRDTLSGQFRMRHRDGHYVWVETFSRLLRDPITGRPTGWVSNSRDISARRRIEQMKDEFVSTVNHELRTPLTAMLGAIGLAMSGQFGTVSQQLSRLLSIVKSNGDRLAALVNDILDFEKVSLGKMRFDLQPRRVDQLLERSVAANRPYAEQHGVTLQLLPAPAAAKINVDDERFLQIMANLLSNAAKFSRRESSVEVAYAVSEGRCRISVVDHGVGIPASFRAALFERFAQADGADNRVKGGTGLGMAIAKHLTEHMDGHISFESEENVGTTFHVVFPTVENSDASVLQEERRSQGADSR
jgi:PAS domain S-box-containing protein